MIACVLRKKRVFYNFKKQQTPIIPRSLNGCGNEQTQDHEHNIRISHPLVITVQVFKYGIQHRKSKRLLLFFSQHNIQKETETTLAFT